MAPANSHLPQDNDFAEQLVAATPNKESPMSVIMKRLVDIECQLTSVSSSRKNGNTAGILHGIHPSSKGKLKHQLFVSNVGKKAILHVVVQLELKCQILVRVTNKQTSP